MDSSMFDKEKLEEQTEGNQGKQSSDAQNADVQQSVYQQAYQQQGAYQQSQQAYQHYQQQYQSQQPYQQAYKPDENGLEEPVSFGDWMVTYLILCIPCINIIMMFVWAFSSDVKKSKSNYFKATLVWALIWTVICIFMLIIFAITFSVTANSLNYY